MQKWALNDTSQKQPPQLDIVSKLQKICDNGSDFFNEYFSSDIEMLTMFFSCTLKCLGREQMKESVEVDVCDLRLYRCFTF